MAKQKYLTSDELLTDKIVYLTPGHAPSIVTTIGPDNNVNVAAFEQTMAVSYNPPRMLLVISPKSDTYKNMIDGSDCVIGFPRIEYTQETYDAGVRAPRNVSELDLIQGITTFKSKVVQPPSIDQCWVNIECRIYSDTPAGDHSLVLLDVLGVSLDRDVWKDDKVARRTGLPSVYYSTSGHFHELGAEHVVSLSENLRHYDNAD